MRWAKVVAPPRPPGFVERPNLDRLLDALSVPRELGRVILVSAPAGQGKTVAVADWIRRDATPPCAWVSLDAGDRDETAFWNTVLTAVAGAVDAADDSPLRADAAADPPRAGERVGPDRATVVAALNALDELPTRLRVVLDDVHEIVGHPAFEGLLDLLRHPLAMLTIVLCSRYDPPVGLERLRLRGRLGEVRVAQLAFSHADAVRLFEDDVALTQEQVATLVERTEGWIAALRLAALSLHDTLDAHAFVAAFAGDDRSVADYLVTEVLARLDAEQRTVLEAACVCSPLTVDLAAELSGVADAGAVLEQLELMTALVTATDRRRTVYRTHELLRSHVLPRSRRRHPTRLGELYRRACRWYDDQGEHLLAMRYAAAAGDVPTVQLLLRSRAVELMARGEFNALVETERTLHAVAEDPRIRLVLGLAAFERGELDRGEELVDSAERELTSWPPEQQDDNVVTFRRIVAARVCLARGRVPGAVAVGTTIDPDAVEGPSLRALALTTRATALLATDRHRARRDAGEALALAEHHDWAYLAVQARSTLALTDTHGGHTERLLAHARTVLDHAGAHGWNASTWTLRARFALATAQILRARPTEALTHIEQAVWPGHAHFSAALAVLHGAAEHDLGDPFAGWRRIQQARVTATDESREWHTTAFAALVEQQAALAAGLTVEAAELSRAMSERLPGAAELALLRARDLWATRDPRARGVLDPALDGRARALCSLAVVEAPLLDAEIGLARGELPTVRRRLLRALELSRRFDVLRPWLHIPDALRGYLAEHRGGFDDLDDLVDEVLATAPAAPPARTAAPLTTREREILALLPTMRSSADIAADLLVSVNTVKTHQRAIYQKLGVENRRDAVARARVVGLLTSTTS